MTKLPSSRQVIRVLESHGYRLKSQKGSHQKYFKGIKTVILPAPRKEIPLGTLKSISRQSGIDMQQFIDGK